MQTSRKIEQESRKIIKIDKSSDLIPSAALWFSEKWEISSEEYKRSMNLSIKHQNLAPKWYVVLGNNNKIIAGAGVIENDFHNRPDLSPNICALFVEETYRQQNIAKELLNFIQKDFKTMGIEKLYLITDHVDFYENLGWKFKTFVNETDGNITRLYESC